MSYISKFFLPYDSVAGPPPLHLKHVRSEKVMGKKGPRRYKGHPVSLR